MEACVTILVMGTKGENGVRFKTVNGMEACVTRR